MDHDPERDEDAMDPRTLNYPPTPEQVREVGSLVGSGATIAQLLHLGKQGGRSWRRWVSGESEISFGNWYTLNVFAELRNSPSKI